MKKKDNIKNKIKMLKTMIIILNNYKIIENYIEIIIKSWKNAVNSFNMRRKNI